MKKKLNKRVVTIALMASMVLSMSACGGQSSPSGGGK